MLKKLRAPRSRSVASAAGLAVLLFGVSVTAVAASPESSASLPDAPGETASVAAASSGYSSSLQPDVATAPRDGLRTEALSFAVPGAAPMFAGRAVKANDPGVKTNDPDVKTNDPNQPNRILTQRELDAACQSHEMHGRPCNLRWWPALWESLEATTVENMGNIAMDSDTRNALTTHDFWGAYKKSVEDYRFGQWTDDTPWIVHNIGHPMQGAAVYAIYAQNDPKARGLQFENSKLYWYGKLRAMAFVTVYEIQWKLGPASEASIGNSGYNTYFLPSAGRTTNETGFQDFFITPVYGLGWDVMEDLIDKHLMPKIWHKTHNKWILTALLPLTPTRAGANWLRYKPAYYRDYDLPPVEPKHAKAADAGNSPQ